MLEEIPTSFVKGHGRFLIVEYSEAMLSLNQQEKQLKFIKSPLKVRRKVEVGWQGISCHSVTMVHPFSTTRKVDKLGYVAYGNT